MSLTARQQEVLTFINRYIDKQGYPPSRAEICDAFRFTSPTSAQDHLHALERKGVIEIIPRVARGIRIKN